MIINKDRPLQPPSRRQIQKNLAQTKTLALDYECRLKFFLESHQIFRRSGKSPRRKGGQPKSSEGHRHRDSRQRNCVVVKPGSWSGLDFARMKKRLPETGAALTSW